MASSPTVWLRWLSHELLRLRKEAGLERAEVATAIRCTTQKIGHLETAHTPPKIKDLEEILLPMYKVPKERWPYYLQAARDARKKGWWENYTDAMPTWFSLYVGLEQGASELYSWDPLLVHGLLQTREYMTAVVRGDSPELARRRSGADRRGPAGPAERPRCRRPAPACGVVSEAALRSNIGGPKIMRDQLEHVWRWRSGPGSPCRCCRSTLAPTPGCADLSHHGLPHRGRYRRGVPGVPHRGALPRGRAQVKEHQISFEHLSSQALSPAASRKRIAAIAEEFT